MGLTQNMGKIFAFLVGSLLASTVVRCSNDGLQVNITETFVLQCKLEMLFVLVFD